MVGCGPPVFLQHGLEGSSALWYFIQDLKIICCIILVFLTLRSWHRNVLAISLVSFLESITAVSTLLCAKTKPSLCRLLPGPHRGSLAFMLAEGVGSKQYQLKTTAWGMECWFWINFDLMKDCYELWTSPSKFAGLRRLAWQLPWQPWESRAHETWSGYWLRILAIFLGRDGQVEWMKVDERG